MDVYALQAKLHMRKFGTTIEQLACIAAKNHANGTLNSQLGCRAETRTGSDVENCAAALSFHDLKLGAHSEESANDVDCPATLHLVRRNVREGDHVVPDSCVVDGDVEGTQSGRAVL
ncbi:hypothetical protein [Variovorax paradoxus]|uniref:hypothetical protein n=1 Tax=Variovorax paradoxus TaxID=34073 RepID=UPI003F5139D6